MTVMFTTAVEPFELRTQTEGPAWSYKPQQTAAEWQGYDLSFGMSCVPKSGTWCPLSPRHGAPVFKLQPDFGQRETSCCINNSYLDIVSHNQSCSPVLRFVTPTNLLGAIVRS